MNHHQPTGLIRETLATIAFVALCYIAYVTAWGAYAS